MDMIHLVCLTVRMEGKDPTGIFNFSQFCLKSVPPRLSIDLFCHLDTFDKFLVAIRLVQNQDFQRLRLSFFGLEPLINPCPCVSMSITMKVLYSVRIMF